MLYYFNLINEVTKDLNSLIFLANKMNITIKKLIDKLYCRVDFSINEIKILLNYFSPLPFQYLFKK